MCSLVTPAGVYHKHVRVELEDFHSRGAERFFKCTEAR